MTDTPIHPKIVEAVRACDDDQLIADMKEAVRRAPRAHDGKRMSELFDETTITNIVLQITEGSSAIEDHKVRSFAVLRPLMEAVARAGQIDAHDTREGENYSDPASIVAAVLARPLGEKE